MGQYDVVGDFIRAYGQGQGSRRFDRQEAEAIEDRDIEKQLLAHRLKEIKIQERLRARELAKENLGLRSGRAQNDIPEAHLQPLTDDQLQGDRSPGMIATMPGTIRPAQRRMAPMTIPGVPEYGIPDEQQTPQTMEEIISRIAGEAAAKRTGDFENVSPGGVVFDPITRQPIYSNPRTFAPPNPQGVDVNLPGGRVERLFVTPKEGLTIDRGTPPDNMLVPVTERDENGVETTTFVPRPDAANTTAKRFPIPPQGGSAEINPRAYNAQVALDALTELEKILNQKDLRIKGEDKFWFKNMVGDEDTDPDPGYTAAVAAATQALAQMSGGRESDVLAASSELSSAGDIETQRAAVTKAIERAKKALATATTRVPTGMDALRRGGGRGQAPAAGGSGAVWRDGKIYIDGKLVGEP